MKNAKISVKLIIGFSVVILLAVAIGTVGIIGMRTIATAGENMYRTDTLAIENYGRCIAALQQARVEVHSLVISVQRGDQTNAKMAAENYKAKLAEAGDAWVKAIENPSGDEEIELIETSQTAWYGGFIPYNEETIKLALDGDIDGAYAALDKADIPESIVSDATDRLIELKSKEAADTLKNNTNTSNLLIMVLIITIVIAIITAVIMALRIAALIAKPIAKIAHAAREIALGHTDVDVKYESKDELGTLADAFGRMVDGINTQAHVVERLADGDLTAEIIPRSDEDVMGLGLQKTIANLNNMFAGISCATQQVASGSKQIADGATSLAEDAVHQAGVVDQLSNHIAAIASKTRENTSMASNAAQISDIILNNTQKGSEQMEQMLAAVKEINDASQCISKVIKVIDDIAFQTNILALNAAVEAARAGLHGKGFAVVAEEVRNLASKSSDAAKETGQLIANSMEKAELGSCIATRTADSLAEIVSSVNQSAQLIVSISKSSNEQETSILQINKDIDEVAQIVQHNSASAEESAAASEEMSGQSSVLEELMSQFKLKGNNGFDTLMIEG